jgi:LysR family transcriptional regulator, mexEF-oprN operon transcriptional activator
MNEIDLRRFDLNLLVVFEVLMAECSVTRAAERLGRTQSAVSHSLSRLRARLGDPLLIKGARGMQPTDFALELMAQVRPTLRGIQRALSARQAFDPTTSRRLFRFAAPDFARTLFTSLLARVRTEAPGISIEWTGARDPMLLQIADGQIDVAIAPADLRLPDGVTGERVGALKWECFARQGHPAFREWGPTAWSRWPHVAVRVGDSLTSPVSAAAAAAGLQRTIVGWVPHFSAIAPVLGDSDLLATLPSLAMLDTFRQYGLESRHVPFSIAPLPHAMLWSAGRSNDPEITWLRDRLRPIVKSKFGIPVRQSAAHRRQAG